MTDSEPVTAVEIVPEALADARAAIRPHLPQLRNIGADEMLVDQLIEGVALAIQGHMHAAELAEAERVQAVQVANTVRQRLLALANQTHVEQWATCPRCHVRAPSVMELRHEPGCRLSSAPPPRRSLPPNTGGN